jgi:iron-sulfur cluster assembly accessory protein
MTTENSEQGQTYTAEGFSLKITVAAQKKLASIPGVRDGTEGLRLLVRGGGCSGFRQEIKIDTTQEDDITIFVDEKIRVVIDPQSALILNEAVLELEESLLASKLVLINQRAKHACGCGESFSLG